MSPDLRSKVALAEVPPLEPLNVTEALEVIVLPTSAYDTEAEPDRDTAAIAAEEAITDAAVRAISFFIVILLNRIVFCLSKALTPLTPVLLLFQTTM